MNKFLVKVLKEVSLWLKELEQELEREALELEQELERAALVRPAIESDGSETRTTSEEGGDDNTNHGESSWRRV